MSTVDDRLMFRLKQRDGWITTTYGYSVARISPGMNDHEACAQRICDLWNADQLRRAQEASGKGETEDGS